MKAKLILLVVAALVAILVVPAVARAGWNNYAGGPNAVYDKTKTTGGTSGWNNWTNNRVYRPTGHPFYLDYTNGSGYHVSAHNSSTNPFYFAPSGYSAVGCWWAYSDDLSPTVYPVSPQVFI
jgi:hypothetical protein